MKTCAALALPLSTLLLAACSGAPGDSELQQALRQSMQSMGGPAAASTFDAQIKQFSAARRSRGLPIAVT